MIKTIQKPLKNSELPLRKVILCKTSIDLFQKYHINHSKQLKIAMRFPPGTQNHNSPSLYPKACRLPQKLSFQQHKQVSYIDDFFSHESFAFGVKLKSGYHRQHPFSLMWWSISETVSENFSHIQKHPTHCNPIICVSMDAVRWYTSTRISHRSLLKIC